MGEKGAVDHYAAVLADLEAKLAAIQNAIATIKAIQSGSAIVAPIGLSAPIPNAASGQVELPIDAFHRLTISKAIRKYLQMRPNRPATTPEIVEALRAGGQKGAEGSNFMVVVNNTLNRMQAPGGGISKVKRGVWGLTEWYQDKAKKGDE